MAALLAAKYRIDRTSVAAQREQQVARFRLQQNRPGLAPFSKYRDLPALGPRHPVAPLQLRQFGDAHARHIKKTQHHLIAARGRTIVTFPISVDGMIS